MKLRFGTPFNPPNQAKPLELVGTEINNSSLLGVLHHTVLDLAAKNGPKNE